MTAMWRTEGAEIAYGLCRCGCGEKAPLAPQTHRARGWVKGEPLWFVFGHNMADRDWDGRCNRCLSSDGPFGDRQHICSACRRHASSAKRAERTLERRNLMPPVTCSDCGSLFTEDRRSTRCPPCREANRREMRRRNSVASRGTDPSQRGRQVKSRYGLSPEELGSLLEFQGERCAICGRTADEAGCSVLSVDHCHATGCIRGLLCRACNSGIGQLGDSAKVVKLAFEYLDRSESRPGCGQEETL